jgi:transcriptional regulator with XRE-family HTH domain
MGTISRISSAAKIGERLFEIRRALGHTQSKVAAELGTSDRSYKHYEAGTRDLLIEMAIAFCDKFNTDLNWLALGKKGVNKTRAKTLTQGCVVAVMTRAQILNIELSPQKSGSIAGYLFSQCLEKGTDPNDEVIEVMEFASDLVNKYIERFKWPRGNHATINMRVEHRHHPSSFVRREAGFTPFSAAFIL